MEQACSAEFQDLVNAAVLLTNGAVIYMAIRMLRHKKLYDRVVDAVVEELLPEWRKKKKGGE